MQWCESEWRIRPALCSKLCELWDRRLGVGEVLGEVATRDDAPEAFDLGLTTGRLASAPSSPGSFATMAVMSGPFWNTCTSDLGLVLVLACGSLVMLMLVTFFFVLLTVIQLSLLLTDWSCKDTEIKLLFFIYWLSLQLRVRSSLMTNISICHTSVCHGWLTAGLLCSYVVCTKLPTREKIILWVVKWICVLVKWTLKKTIQINFSTIFHT